MVKYKLQHDRPDCIGCGACVSNCPNFWEMDSKEARSNLKLGKKLENGWTEREIDEKDFECNMEAAESCPVNVIHLIDIESEEKKI